MKNKQKKIVLGAAIASVVLGVFILSKIFFNSPADVILKDMRAGAVVLIDGKDAVEVSSDGDMSIDLPFGQHTVAVSGDNFWPWVTSVSVFEGEKQDIILRPIFLAKDAVTEVVDVNDEKNKSILDALEKSMMPTKEKPIILSDDEALYVENNVLYLLKAGTSKAVFLPKMQMTSVALYPKRVDTFLVTLGSDIFAIAVDTKEPRSFQPVYHGENPYFTVVDNALFIHDKKRIIKREL
jgi:hypothetical protein